MDWFLIILLVILVFAIAFIAMHLRDLNDRVVWLERHLKIELDEKGRSRDASDRQ